MRKFILVLFIGMVLAMDIYGVVNDILAEIAIKEAKEEVATVVYME